MDLEEVHFQEKSSQYGDGGEWDLAVELAYTTRSNAVITEI